MIRRKKLRDIIVEGDGDERHGTPNGYSNLGCRGLSCCIPANRKYYQGLRAKRKPPPPGDQRHGTDGCYINYRCRRPECREAHRLAGLEYRAKRSANLDSIPRAA